jgi:hypothetical protein|tara:strand:- start:515 stop:949 length:435 start_codon:yes stop_codon:yes gene_type:complete
MNLDDVFKSIYSAIVEAQNTVEQHYLGEIKEDYFDKDGNPHTVPLSLPVGNSGKMQIVKVPTITLVPHYGMAIKEVSIEMEVALSDNDEEVTDKGKGGKLRRFMTDLSKRNKSKRMAQIKVVFNGKDTPEGLARIKDNLNKLIP